MQTKKFGLQMLLWFKLKCLHNVVVVVTEICTEVTKCRRVTTVLLSGHYYSLNTPTHIAMPSSQQDQPSPIYSLDIFPVRHTPIADPISLHTQHCSLGSVLHLPPSYPSRHIALTIKVSAAPAIIHQSSIVPPSPW